MADTPEQVNDVNTRSDRDPMTPEVGSEGGSPGDVETVTESGPAAGSEAGETWTPTRTARDTVVRDETGQGRRSP